MRAWTLALILSVLAGPAFAALDRPLDLTCTTQDGLRIATSWYSAGTGTARPLVLLMPGFAQRRGTRSMNFVITLLTPTADVLILDARGTGGSEGRFSFGAEELWDLAAARKALPRAYARTVLLGFSLGAYTCLRAVAEARVQADALLLVSAPMRLERIVSSGGVFLNPLLMGFQKASYAVEPQSDNFFRWGALFQAKPSVRDFAAKISCPSHFLAGGRDRLVFSSHSRAVFEALPQPKTWDLWPDGLHAEAMALQHPLEFQAWVAQALR